MNLSRLCSDVPPETRVRAVVLRSEAGTDKSVGESVVRPTLGDVNQQLHTHCAPSGCGVAVRNRTDFGGNGVKAPPVNRIALGHVWDQTKPARRRRTLRHLALSRPSSAPRGLAEN